MERHKKQLQQLKKLPFHALATRNLTFFLLSYPKWYDLLLLDLFLSYFLYVFICRHTYYVLVRTKRKTLKEEKKLITCSDMFFLLLNILLKR